MLQATGATLVGINMRMNIYRHAKRIVVAVIGATVLLGGVALLVLPGPGLLIIAVGLGILATEFVWARRLLQRAKEEGGELASQLRGKPRDKKHHTNDEES